MKNFDDEREKQELLRAVAETKEIAPKLIEKGRNLTEAGQFALDLATNIGNLATTSSTFIRDPMFPYVLGGLREFNSVARNQDERMTEYKNLTRILHATTTVTASTTTSITYVSCSKAEISPGAESMKMLLRRSADVTGVRESMKVLGLDAAHGSTHSPVELLQTAEVALKRPFADEGCATAVLVPLRQSIQGTIDELLKRRPFNEKTGSLTKKIMSIAHHFGNKGMSPDHINRVAETTHAIINDLSGAKDQRMNRERIASLFYQGISLLQDIVSLIDRDKVRPCREV